MPQPKLLLDRLGQSRKSAQELLGDTGDLLTGFGFTQDSALDLIYSSSKVSD